MRHCLITLIAATCLTSLTTAAVTNTTTAETFTTIQAAINDADTLDGHTLTIDNGTYAERPVVNKELTLIGASEAGVIIDAAAATSGSYGMSISADNVTVKQLTLVGNTSMSTPRYGFKPSNVANLTLESVTAKEFYRTGVDLLGVTNAVLTNITSIDNGGHGLAITDCNGVTLNGATLTGNAWQAISFATWGQHSPLGMSGVVVNTPLTYDGIIQFEMGDHNNSGAPPTGDAIITYSTNPADGADVTLPASLFGFALHGAQDDTPPWARIYPVDTLATAAVIAAAAPISHLTGEDMYIEDLNTAGQWYVTPGCSIQAAVDAASAGDTISITAGTYAEAVDIETDDLTLLGPNAGINPNTAARGAEAVIYPDLTDPNQWYGVGVTGANVTLDGLIFDGDNPAVASGVNINGADSDLGYGIVGSNPGGGLTLANSIVRNWTAMGFVGWMGDSTPSSDNLITNNLFTNIYDEDLHDGRAIVPLWSYYADVIDNVVTQSAIGLYAENASNASATAPVVWSGNDVTASRSGIWYNLVYGSATPLTITDNTVRPEDNPDRTRWDGVWLTSLGNSTTDIVPSITDNTIIGLPVTQMTVGYQLWNDRSASGITLTGGSVSDCDYGVWVNNYDGYNASNGGTTTVIVDGVAISGASLAGVYVKDNPDNTNSAEVFAQIGAGTTIAGSGYDVMVEGLDAQVTAVDAGLAPLTFRLIDTSIQNVIDVARDGDTLSLAPGEFVENITIDKLLKIIGSGSGVDPLSDSIITNATTAAVATLSASGTSAADPVLLQDLRIAPVGAYGINVASSLVEYIELDNVQVVGDPSSTIENEVGLKVSTLASLQHVTITDSAFDQCDYGWYFAKHGDQASGGSMVSDFYVANTSFSNNSYKGIYVEKLSDATFEQCEFVDNGADPMWNSDWNGGVDINLKGQELYQNLVFDCCTVTGNGLGYKEGAGYMIKARGTGTDTSYATYPATLTNVSILGGIVTGNERGIRLGEPGKDNTGPTAVVINDVNLFGNVGTYPGADGSAYGDLVDQRNTADAIDATSNWWGQAGGPVAGQVYENSVAADTSSPRDALSDACNAFVTLNAVDTCLAAGETELIVTLDVSNTPEPYAGGQFFLSYDTTKLTFVSAVAGSTDFPELFEFVDAGAGTIDYAVNEAVYGGGGSAADQTLVVLTFDVVGEFCAAADLVSFRTTNPPSRLTTFGGQEIPSTLLDLGAVTSDSTPPTLTCAADITIDTDPGLCEAAVAVGTPTVSDGCCLDTVVGVRSDDPLAELTDLYPVGTTTITWTATDCCGNTSSCEQTIEVEDNEPPTITCPADVTVYADAGSCGADAAYVVLGTPTVGDNCGIASGYPISDAPTSYPLGTTTVTWTVQNVNGNETTCEQVVEVLSDSELDVVVELASVFETGLTRCITFDLWDGSTTTTVQAELTFDTLTGTGVSAAGVVQVPCGGYTCISARDALHTLRRVDGGFSVVGTQFVADFTAAGGGALISGNLNDDAYVDILDFGVFTSQYNSNYGTGDTTCATAAPHADFSGNGIVFSEDFSFIQTQFLEFGDPACGSTPAPLAAASGPVTSITVAELIERGLGDLASADLTGDGVLDEADMEAFASGLPQHAIGDLNCDGFVDTYDIDAFVVAVAGEEAYAAQYPDCDVKLADCNRDGQVDTYDIDAFVDLLGQ